MKTFYTYSYLCLTCDSLTEITTRVDADHYTPQCICQSWDTLRIGKFEAVIA